MNLDAIVAIVIALGAGFVGLWLRQSGKDAAKREQKDADHARANEIERRADDARQSDDDPVDVLRRAGRWRD